MASTVEPKNHGDWHNFYHPGPLITGPTPGMAGNQLQWWEPGCQIYRRM
ncbi:hypothetical protein [Salmonella bongori]|nr:hypothetical protein [Salmonella bongori]QVP39316.1 hypothetical protein AIT23_10265 [Salmonella bongori serovar 40:z35:-]